jgi:uncharacterized cupin superfamily protein
VSKPIVNLADVPLRTATKGTKFSAQLGRIGSLIGAQQLGAQLHIVPPGKAAFPRHAHHRNEEMMIILSGEGEYQRGDETWPIRAGDVIAAPASTGEQAHQTRNTGSAPLHYLAISTRHDPEITEYPDSGKFSVASQIPPDKGMAGARVRFTWHGDAPSIDYWDGEDIGETE